MIKMETTKPIKIKQEPGVVPSSSEDIVITDYTTKSNNVNHNNIQNEDGSKPEFVSIKIEKCSDDTITSESQSDIDTTNWHTVPIKGETNVPQINIDISIKEEPEDTVPAYDEENPGFIVPDSHPTPPTTRNTFISDISEEILSLNSTVDGQYMCPICDKRFANKGNVNRHVQLHTREKLECNICFRQFVKQGHYQKHILTHSKEKRFKCDSCDKLFRTSSNLEQHRRIHLPVKPFECDTCKRQFAVRANLLKHQNSNKCKLTEPIVCNICDKVFKKEFLLKSHLRKHTTERPYQCNICKMTFKYKSTLIRHEQLHNNVKPYSCNICMKKFTHSGLIKPHMRKHTGEKPYACPICNKLFAHKHNMQRHTLRHAKQKNLVCHVCNKVFPKESRLIYHMRTHTKAKPFICGVCGKSFSHRQNIVRHYSRKHPNEKYSCTDTDASVAKDVWENIVLKNLAENLGGKLTSLTSNSLTVKDDADMGEVTDSDDEGSITSRTEQIETVNVNMEEYTDSSDDESISIKTEEIIGKVEVEIKEISESGDEEIIGK